MYGNRCCNVVPKCFERDDYVSIEEFVFPELTINYRCNICYKIIN